VHIVYGRKRMLKALQEIFMDKEIYVLFW